jgi:hypothetical protein
MIRIVKVDLTSRDHTENLIRLLDHYAMDPMGGSEPLAEYVKDNLIDQMKARPEYAKSYILSTVL